MKILTGLNLLSAMGDNELTKLYTNFPKCEKMIYLDAVISGRASHTILMGFREAKYTPYAILMVDRHVAKLSPKYTWLSRQLERQELAKLVYVSRLVAKDSELQM